MTRFGSEGNSQDKEFTVSAPLSDVEPAFINAIAKFFQLEPIMRSHPGHQFTAKFIPQKHEFLIGEGVTGELQISNIGSNDFTFVQGGRQRGSRDNQFSFSGKFNQKVIPDIGNPVHFGGIGAYVTIEPGESRRIAVDLRKWFAFGEPGSYFIRGCYYFKIVNPALKQYRSLWEEYACDEFLIRIKKG